MQAFEIGGDGFAGGYLADFEQIVERVVHWSYNCRTVMFNKAIVILFARQFRLRKDV